MVQGVVRGVGDGRVDDDVEVRRQIDHICGTFGLAVVGLQQVFHLLRHQRQLDADLSQVAHKGGGIRIRIPSVPVLRSRLRILAGTDRGLHDFSHMVAFRIHHLQIQADKGTVLHLLAAVFIHALLIGLAVFVQGPAVGFKQMLSLLQIHGVFGNIVVPALGQHFPGRNGFFVIFLVDV